MALYFYKALSRDGKKITGYLDASSSEAIKGQLVAKNLYPIEIKLSSGSIKTPFLKTLFEKPVATKDLIYFTKQLGVLLKSGVPLMQSLELLSEQFSGQLKSIIINLKDGVKEGKSLADGLMLYPKTFGKIYVQLIKAGEATGKLEIILDRLTQYLERQDEIQKKVSGALTYPMVQIGVICIVVVIIMVAVIPNLKTMLKSGGKELPFATQFLLTGSYLLSNYYIPIILILLIITVIFQYWKSTPSGKETIDHITLKLPLIKYFARTSAKTLKDARDKIVKQGKITPFLKETGLFPPMATYLINTGEQSGKLDFMLLTVAKNYESELTELTDKITDNIPTIMTFVMAGVVGFIMFAIMGPILEMYNMSGV
ncbi:type II secretion system F family protein [Candidatus Dependentiae bacterium]|nr:type II secretion system F family protein [Candidatus Dependentiae bacterium]